ncbi:transposase [Moorella sp. Hama-1]|uniref:transposase n=1 Tax=Moorella sp. Hama-1 TaxID=2138101 RepID=UPI000D644C8B|nr:transposase [Moorella sp. Hama-1]BCV20521.1 hypothetical protein hamaS1_05900 [Moorella sp. Hama-1]BCV21096.1 hypothetical protein hamaS1_11650 [Moorella sp. Hama-1]
MMYPYQPSLFVDDGQGLFYWKIAHNYPWEVFNDIAQEFKEIRYKQLKQQSPQSLQSNRDQETFFEDFEEGEVDLVDPLKVEGRSPRGRKGIPFWPLLRAFVMARLMRVEDSVKDVHFLLHTNPTFARALGFEELPSYHTVARFDQIMSENGLWEKARIKSVKFNIDNKVFFPLHGNRRGYYPHRSRGQSTTERKEGRPYL